MFSWSWGRPHFDQSFTIFQLYFWLWKQQECDNLHICQGIVSLTYTGHSNNAVFLVYFCYVEHRQLTKYSVWHESLPDHARPCQNTWVPHYAAACDWLKSKDVSTLTDRNEVVYWCSSHQDVVLDLPNHMSKSALLFLLSRITAVSSVVWTQPRTCRAHWTGLFTQYKKDICQPSSWLLNFCKKLNNLSTLSQWTKILLLCTQRT